MTRYLFVVPPWVGHINPTVGVGAALRERGHEVAWAGEAGLLGKLLDAGSVVYPCALPEVWGRPENQRGFAALKHLWEEVLVPLAETMEPGLVAAVADFEPDVLVVDQQALAGALIAEKLGLPWVTSATTSSELTDPLAELPKVRDWLNGLIGELRKRLDAPDTGTDPRFSPHLVLAFASEAMVGDVAVPGGGPVAFVGPVLRPADAAPEFPWQDLPGDGPLVFVSLGTINADAGRRFVAAAAEALRARPELRGVIVDPDGVITDPPPNVLARPSVPQLAVLERAAAVVCHAGHNTVCEALSFGLPLVVAPIRDDQPIIADQVVNAGAGIRLRFVHADAARIGAAIDEVLRDPAYRANANRLRDSFASAGGAYSAVHNLERVGSNTTRL